MAAKVRVLESGLTQLTRDYIDSPDLEDRADRVLTTAQENAPVLSGEYKAGLHKIKTDTGYRIGGSTDHDIYVEADTGNLARSLDAAGGS